MSYLVEIDRRVKRRDSSPRYVGPYQFQWQAWLVAWLVTRGDGNNRYQTGTVIRASEKRNELA